MEVVEDLVLITHLISAITIVGLVLIQHGKGAEAGTGFGSGSAGTVFGSGGSGNFLTKMTTIAAILFFVTSFTLAYFAKEKSESGPEFGNSVINQETILGELPEGDVVDAIDSGVPESEVPEEEVPGDASEVDDSREVPQD